MTFTSAVLGEVQHPTNIIREYLEKFRGTQKCKALILSWLDGWIQTKLRQGKPPWVYVTSQELAIASGYCRDTVHRHLKQLCERKIIQRLPYKRWPTDNIFSYTIDFEKLQQELGCSLSPVVGQSAQKVENQTADSQNSECPESESQPPTVQNQNTYISTIPNPSLSPPQTTTDVGQKKEGNVEEPTEEIPVSDLIESGDSGDETKDICSDKLSAAESKEVLRKVRDDLQIGLNETLQTLITSSPSQVVKDAIAAYQEAYQQGRLKNPIGFLTSAILGQWKPATKHEDKYPPDFRRAYQWLCDAGVVLPEPVESLPVVMGEINVRVPTLNRKPWDPPYQLLPWRVAIQVARE